VSDRAYVNSVDICTCNGPIARHSELSCIDYDIIRENFYTASNLKGLFHNIHLKHIISFIHAIGLTNKL